MNNEQTELVVTEKELVINMLIAAWDAQNKNFNEFLSKVTDEELAAETAPGRNTGTYLLGHLTAVNDNIIKLMDFGEKKYPELLEIFITSPDKSGKEMPPVSALREYYHTVTNELNNNIKKMTSNDWFSRHTAVSAEDFEKEPHRNKLNILISRTSHLSYHLGQLIFLLKK
jgi:hypothetical protein